MECQNITPFGTLIDRFIPSRRGSKVFLIGLNPPNINIYRGIYILVYVSWYVRPLIFMYILVYICPGIYTWYIYLLYINPGIFMYIYVLYLFMAWYIYILVYISQDIYILVYIYWYIYTLLYILVYIYILIYLYSSPKGVLFRIFTAILYI